MVGVAASSAAPLNVHLVFEHFVTSCACVHTHTLTLSLSLAMYIYILIIYIPPGFT